MRAKLRYGWLAAALVITVLRPVRAEITEQQVRQAIQRGVAYLKSQQNKERGNWSEHPGFPSGVTALCTLALLNAGVPVDDPTVSRALGYLRSKEELAKTYSVALQTMVFCAAEPNKDRLLIRRNVQWLQQAQIKSGDRKGAWGYSNSLGGGDGSNTQFAVLGLHEAARAGFTVDQQTWRLVLAYWLKDGHQKTDGSWGYFPDMAGRASMTCAGIASVIIAKENLPEFQGEAKATDQSALCCGGSIENDAVDRALDWLGAHFSVWRNFSAGVGGNAGELLYYLYGVERVGRLTGQRFFGREENKDWYRSGAQKLVGDQDALTGHWKGDGRAESNPHIGTALALLFLSKGQRPVVIARLKHGGSGLGATDDDWNRHRKGVHYLTRYVEKKWKLDLTWQTIDVRLASVEDLMETPVLFISGGGPLRLTDAQKQNLLAYVNQGGFIFAEACDGAGCDGAAFDRDFRALMQQLFKVPLRPLRADHPIWFAEEEVIPSADRPLLGIDACCRTSIVYCPRTLSCYWELGRGGFESPYAEPVAQDVAQAQAIGVNVLSYATNRQLKGKLQAKIVVSDNADTQSSRGVLSIAKLSHGGGADDAPNALVNMLDLTRRQTKIRISTQRRLIAPDDENLFRYPILFMHGRRSFRFSQQEREALHTYLLRGGLLFADAICASPQFAESFRRELSEIFPDAALERLPREHPLFSQDYRGFDLRTVTLRTPREHRPGEPLLTRDDAVAPLLEGLQIDGRLAVVFSPYDISCAMENYASVECKGYIKADAARIAVNVILFALQQ